MDSNGFDITGSIQRHREPTSGHGSGCIRMAGCNRLSSRLLFSPLLPTVCMCLWLPRCFVCLTVCPLKLACGVSIFSFKHQQRPAAFTADVWTDNAVIRPGEINVWPRRQKRQTYKTLRAGFLWRCFCFSVSWT